MLGETLRMRAPQTERPLLNAISESLVLHARNLCDFCRAPWQRNDIRPTDLFVQCDTPAYNSLRTLFSDVARAYRTDAHRIMTVSGKTELKSPKWAFDKMLAHPTRDRGTCFDYQPFLDLVVPKLKLLIDEIGRLEKAEGRDFPIFDLS
jgi:hypothetical protein